MRKHWRITAVAAVLVLALAVGFVPLIHRGNTTADAAAEWSDSGIQAEYGYGTVFTLPQRTVTVDGTSAAATTVLQFPDGSATRAASVTLGMSGVYTLTYSATVAGKAYAESETFTVRDDMVTFGSYMKKDASIGSSARQISICDTLFAVFAAMIVIPSIFAGSASAEAANEAMKASGPSLMFEVLPNMFNAMPGGRIVGAVFFILVFFAALTSSISLVETIVAVLRENCNLKRWAACLIVFGVMLVLGTLSSLGFGVLDTVHIGGKNILNIFDYLSNSILMPIVAIITCILAGFFADTQSLMDEIGMRKKGYRMYYKIMVRYIAPVCMAAILISGIYLSL